MHPEPTAEDVLNLVVQMATDGLQECSTPSPSIGAAIPAQSCLSIDTTTESDPPGDDTSTTTTQKEEIMDPIHVLALPHRDAEAMREDLYARFADDTVIPRVSRGLVAALTSTRIRRPRRRSRTVALAH